MSPIGNTKRRLLQRKNLSFMLLLLFLIATCIVGWSLYKVSTSSQAEESNLTAENTDTVVVDEAADSAVATHQEVTSQQLKSILDAYSYYSVSVIELTGNQYVYSYNDNQKIYAASLFKLFSAHMLMNYIEKGRLSWDSLVYSGQTADACFEAMLVVSEDYCAHAIISLLGGEEAVQQWFQDQGFTDTSYIPTYVTTARDVANFFAKLYRGELANKLHTAKLIGTLERQVFRQGIPNAVEGATVADKVGMYQSYLHDAGIVTINGRVFAISILSDGGTWEGISDITSQIMSRV